MESPIQGNQVRGHLDTMILSILEQEESHGFNIVKRLEQAGEGSLKLREGTIYPVLYRIEAAGLVKAKWEKNDSGRKGPRRKIYSLTSKGRKQLEAGRTEWTQFVNIVGAIVGGAV
jgi:PadR family transcriptional regulator PadR